MSNDTASTRRAFLKTGALFTVPLAVPAVAATGAMASGGDLRSHHADEAAIRALHQDWLRDVNRCATMVTPAGDTIRRIAADHAGEPDAIHLTADGRRATARFACTVEVETAPPQGGTFAQMARLQGNGGERRTERRIVAADYAKADGIWAIARTNLA